MIAETITLNPYPGIRSFRENEGHLFFGRETQTTELFNKLLSKKFVAVVGVSGTGKSSLVHAGLIPILKASNWRVASMCPSDNPIEQLSEALNDTLDEFIEKDFTAITLGYSSLGLVDNYKQSGYKGNLLVVIDQFEEIFRFKSLEKDASSRDQSIRFMNLIINSVLQNELPIYIVITMRSDFLGTCVEFKGLPELINEGQFLIPRLSRNEYRDVITKPLQAQGIEISPTLVSSLLNDIGNDPDQLPVLQHALMLTFDAWLKRSDNNNLIDVQDYEIVGGMSNGIDEHCNSIFQELKSSGFEQASVRVFQRLTEVNAEGIQIRRPTKFSELVDISGQDEEVVATIIESFRKEGRNFLLPFMDILEPETIVDIAHESIMRKWQLLNLWILQEEDNKITLKRLLDHWGSYRDGERSLLVKRTLSNYVDWEKFKDLKKSDSPENLSVLLWAKRYTNDFTKAIDFINRSKEWQTQKRKIVLVLSITSFSIMSFFIFSELWDFYTRERKSIINQYSSKIDSLNKTIEYKEHTLRQTQAIIQDAPRLKSYDSLTSLVDALQLKIKYYDNQINVNEKKKIDSLVHFVTYYGDATKKLSSDNREMRRQLILNGRQLSKIKTDSGNLSISLRKAKDDLNIQTKLYNDSIHNSKMLSAIVKQEFLQNQQLYTGFKNRVDKTKQMSSLKNSEREYLDDYMKFIEKDLKKSLSMFNSNMEITIVLPYKNAQTIFASFKDLLLREGFSGKIAMDTKPSIQQRTNTVIILTNNAELRSALGQIINTNLAKYSIRSEPFLGILPTGSKSFIVINL